MLIKNGLLLLLGLIFSQTSFATESKFNLYSKAFIFASSDQDLPRPLPNDDLPTQPPDDAPKPIGSFSFKDGKELFDKGLLPTEQGLVGNWNVIAWGDLSKSFAGMTNFYAENGKINDDGSKMMVAFGWKTKEITNEKQFFSSFSNFGFKDANRGPNQARIDIGRKAAVTSIYAAAGRNISASYFVFDCRQVHNNSDLVICGVTLKLNGEKTPPDQKVYDNVMGGMLVLKKQR